MKQQIWNNQRKQILVRDTKKGSACEKKCTQKKAGNRQKEVNRTIHIFASQLIKNNDCIQFRLKMITHLRPNDENFHREFSRVWLSGREQASERERKNQSHNQIIGPRTQFMFCHLIVLYSNFRFFRNCHYYVCFRHFLTHVENENTTPCGSFCVFFLLSLCSVLIDIYFYLDRQIAPI